MNIFYVHTDPVVAAQSLCDKHVVKMTLETAQILSAALHIKGFGFPWMMRPTSSSTGWRRAGSSLWRWWSGAFRKKKVADLKKKMDPALDFLLEMTKYINRTQGAIR